MAKKKQKKKGCLVTLMNFLIFLICLVVTALIFYFAYIVVTGDATTDPIEEMKKLPEKLKDLPGLIEEMIEKSKSKGGEPTTE